MSETAFLHFGTALLPEGWRENVRIVIANGVITGVASDVPPSGADERHAIGLPGIANLHSHAFQRAMAGMAEHAGRGEDDFWSWREAMYRVALSVSPDDVEAIAAELYVEMLEAGFTRVGEFHYLHHDIDGSLYGDLAEMALRILSAASVTGIGMTLLPVFYAHGDFGGAPANAGQRRFVCALDQFATLFAECTAAAAQLPGANVGIAPHSLRAVTPEELSTLIELGKGRPVHIHAAEQVREVEASLAVLGERPVEWLVDHAGIDAHWCLIHATHMTAAETKALAESGATAGLCPITEANLGDGVFKGRLFLEEGGAFGVGSDSNVFVDPAAELRQLEYSQRLRDRARNRMGADEQSTGRTLFDMAVAGGAQALAQPKRGLTPGAAADLVSLRADHRALEGLSGDRILDAWVFAAREPAVDCVWVRGRQQVTGGRHCRRDAIGAHFRAVAERLAG